MKEEEKILITIQALIHAPVKEVWKCWTSPGDIVKWNQASDDWHTTRAENDLRTGGKFKSRMEAKDGSFGFDFWGIYKTIVPEKLIESELGDGRQMKIEFHEKDEHTELVETFEAENTNPLEMQKNGWKGILNNFKKYVESNRE